MSGVITAENIPSGDVSLECDVAIIGSGAGGAVMAYELAKSGLDVLVLEAGPYLTSSQFTEKLPEMMEALYVDSGFQTNKDGDLGVLQGRCVGGSTVVNGCVAFRTPEFVLETWQKNHGLVDFTPDTLWPYFDKIENNLSVHENQDYEINTNSRVQIRGCEELGISWKKLQRNTKQCAMTGHCLSGCKTDRKQSMLVTYIPWALSLGARVFADTEVEKIHVENNVVKGLSAKTRDGNGDVVAEISVTSKIVVSSAGAINTPLLFLKSHIANSSGQVGKNFACHPSCGVYGEFEESIYAWRGAMLGTYVDQYMRPEEGGFVLEGGGAGPIEMALSTEPGTGEDHINYMLKIKNMASMVTLIHDHNVGSVQLIDGKKAIDYRISDSDFSVMLESLKTAAKIFFAAGAKRVFMPTVKKTVINSVNEIDKVVGNISNEPHSLRMVSYHPQGTMRMGVNCKTSVVGPHGETHDIENLYVADASLFPTSIVVNPQMTVYALSNYIADHIKEKDFS